MKGTSILTISLVSSNREDDYFKICVIDESSRNRVVELKLTPKQMSYALASRVVSEVETQYGKLSEIGWTSTTETLICADEKEAQRALAAIQKQRPDSSISYRSSDIGNHHRKTDDNRFNVTFSIKSPPETK